MSDHWTDVNGEHFCDCPGCKLDKDTNDIPREYDAITALIRQWILAHEEDGECDCDYCHTLRLSLTTLFPLVREVYSL